MTKYLDLKTSSGRRNFALCLIFIISVLSTTNHSSFHLVMSSLIEAIREGKISKEIGRYIIRKLKRRGILIDPALTELVAS
jgi:hypothetical protein